MLTKEKSFMPLGMFGAVAYIAHTLIGQALWNDYNPVTTDISSLTALGAPNRVLLSIFTAVYALATIAFITAMIKKSQREYNKLICAGWWILLIMNLVSMFGYALFPLSADKTEMNFTNTMHIIVTVIVVFTTIAGSFTLAFGFLKQPGLKRLGIFALVMSTFITLAGALNPIGMANNWNILGLTERLVIYALQLMMFVYSAYYTMDLRKSEQTEAVK